MVEPEELPLRSRRLLDELVLDVVEVPLRSRRLLEEFVLDVVVLVRFLRLVLVVVEDELLLVVEVPLRSRRLSFFVLLRLPGFRTLPLWPLDDELFLFAGVFFPEESEPISLGAATAVPAASRSAAKAITIRRRERQARRFRSVYGPSEISLSSSG